MTELAIQTGIAIGIYGLLALSLNLQYGLTGVLNFGQVIFFAVGAYSVATAYAHGAPDWVGIVAAPIVAGLAGVIIALPSRQLSEAFWALVSLGAASLFIALVTNANGIAGGALGTSNIPLWSNTTLLIVLAGALVVAVVVIERLRRSQFGRIIRTVRDDETLVVAIGRSLLATRTKVIVVAGVIGTFSGVVYAHWVTFVSPDAFSMSVTLLAFVMVILGGTGNTYGVLVGAVVVECEVVGLQYLPFNLTGGDLALLEQAINGAVLIVLLLFLRRGIFPERKQEHSVASY